MPFASYLPYTHISLYLLPVNLFYPAHAPGSDCIYQKKKSAVYSRTTDYTTYFNCLPHPSESDILESSHFPFYKPEHHKSSTVTFPFDTLFKKRSNSSTQPARRYSSSLSLLNEPIKRLFLLVPMFNNDKSTTPEPYPFTVALVDAPVKALR